MAASRTLGFLLLASLTALASCVSPRDLRLYQVSLCQRGRVPNRQCYPGYTPRDCPDGTSAYGYAFMLCHGRGVCCEGTPTPTGPKHRLSHPDCGTVVPSPRIGFGEPEQVCQSPWQVSMRRVLDVSQPRSIANSVHVAGGVLIHNRWVLTTPFSALLAGRQDETENFGTNMFVALGKHNHNISEPQERLVGVSRVMFHNEARITPQDNYLGVVFNSIQGENIDEIWQENAFALLELETPVAVTDCIRPACLPTGTVPECSPRDCKISGWGANENQQIDNLLVKADVKWLNSEVCQAIQFYSPRGVLARTGCAASDDNAFACVGDFGGPMVCEEDGRQVLEGLTTDRLICDNSSVPVIVSTVNEAMPWIESVITNNL